MECWPAYLRGQADALELPVVDTTNLGIDTVADELVVHVEQLRREGANGRLEARLDAGRSA